MIEKALNEIKELCLKDPNIKKKISSELKTFLNIDVLSEVKQYLDTSKYYVKNSTFDELELESFDDKKYGMFEQFNINIKRDNFTYNLTLTLTENSWNSETKVIKKYYCHNLNCLSLRLDEIPTLKLLA
jgi:hypothetical protein